MGWPGLARFSCHHEVDFLCAQQACGDLSKPGQPGLAGWPRAHVIDPLTLHNKISFLVTLPSLWKRMVIVIGLLSWLASRWTYVWGRVWGGEVCGVERGGGTYI